MASETPEQVAFPSPAGLAGVPPVDADAGLPLMSTSTTGWIDRPPAAPLVAPLVAGLLAADVPLAAALVVAAALVAALVAAVVPPEFDLDEQAVNVMAATTTTARAPRIAARCT
jgi:hypothetical protein